MSNKSKHYNPEEPRIHKVKTKYEDVHKNLDKYPKRIFNLLEEEEDFEQTDDESEYQSSK